MTVSLKWYMANSHCVYQHLHILRQIKMILIIDYLKTNGDKYCFITVFGETRFLTIVIVTENPDSNWLLIVRSEYHKLFSLQ